MVDGDNLGMVGRLRFLGEIPTERLAILVPTWSIETWVLHLIGEAVTEDQPLKERLPRSEFPEALKRAMLSWPNPRPEEAVVVPSLARAREELKNLPL